MLLFSGSVTTAAFARVGRGTRQEAATLTATAVRHTVLVVVGGGLVAAAIGPLLIETLFGRAYGEASTPLRILCLGTAIHAPQGILNLYFINQLGRPHLAVLLSLLAFAVSATAGLLLIPSFGPAGAAWATTLSNVAATGAALVLFLRRTSVPMSELWRVRLSDIAAYFELAFSVLGEARRLALRAVGRAPSQP
jgi:O-antigen/teichoic acid export membrane protein